MAFWVALLPFLKAAGIGAGLGAGGAKLAGKDPKKGALLGASLGAAGAGAPIMFGGKAGLAGWSSLLRPEAAGAKAAATGASTAGMTNAAANAAIAAKTGIAMPAATGAAKTAGLSSLTKGALASALVGSGVQAALPKYSQTQLLMDPGIMSPPSDIMAQLEQLRQKGRV